MRFVDKWHSQMQEQWFSRIRVGEHQFWIAAPGGSELWADVI